MAKKRCACLEHSGDEVWHGTTNGYCYHECRCDRCRTEVSRYMRAYRMRNLERERARGRRYYDEQRESRSEYERLRWASDLGGNRARLRDHRRAFPAAYRARQAKRREREQRMAPNLRPRARWTPADDAVVVDASLTALQAAILLGRSVDSVEGRRRRLPGWRRAA